MRKIAIFVVCIMLMASSFLTFIPIKNVKAEGNTFYVGGSGAGNYSTIQSAINAASSGDTVFVFSGIYYENVVVNKTIDFLGEKKDNTIIDGGAIGDVVFLSADWVNISGLSITNSGGNDWADAGIEIWSDFNTITDNNVNSNINGIYINYSSYNTITGNNINSNYNSGIYLEFSNNNTITENNASNNYCSIYIDSSNNNTITGNNASNNQNSIYLYSSNNNTITGNNASNNYYDGIILDFSSNNTINGNKVSNSSCGILLDTYSNNNTITGNNASSNTRGISLAYSNYNTLTDNNALLPNGWDGIVLSRSNYNTLTGNNASSNKTGGSGIILVYSNYNTLTGNNASTNIDHNYGIRLHNSNNNTITDNNASKNRFGIALNYYSSNNTINDNNVSNNSCGIYVTESSNNTITGNNASSNTRGISLAYSNYNTLTDNNASNNSCGIYLESSQHNGIFKNIFSHNSKNGIYIMGINSYPSYNNIIKNNNFINNTECGVNISTGSPNNDIQLNNFFANNKDFVQAFDSGMNNQWNNSSRGNFWGDYILRYPSATHDGFVWNIPYDLMGVTGSSDHYPLVSPTISGVVFYIFRISPNYGVSSSSIVATIYCIGIINGSTAKLLKEGEEDIEGEEVGVRGNQLTARFNLSGRTVGKWDVVVQLPSGEESSLRGAFEIKDFMSGIYPNEGFSSPFRSIVNVYGHGFVKGVIVKLSKAGEEDIFGEDIIILTEKHLTTRFNLTNKTTGLWDVVVILPNGPQSCLFDAYRIRETIGNGYLLQNISMKWGDSITYGVEVPSTDNLFITLQKTTLVNYGLSWNGKLSLWYEGTEIANTSGSHDHILHIKNPVPGTYAIKITAYQSGEGILRMDLSLPELILGEWTVGDIYTSYGSIWYQTYVPPNVEKLYFEAEGLGLWSHFAIYYDQFGGSPHWMSPVSSPDLHNSYEIPSPIPGMYIVEFMDSAMIYYGKSFFDPEWGYYSRWCDNQIRDVLIKADTTFSYEPPPDYVPIITSISPERGGNTGFVTVEIHGAWLDENATVLLFRSNYNNITSKFVQGSGDSTSLIALFNLTDKDPGEWYLKVINSNGRNTTAATSFIIENGIEPEIWAEIIGGENARLGRETKYILRCGNSGNIDVNDVFIWVKAPKSWEIRSDLNSAEPDFQFPSENSSLCLWISKIPADSIAEYNIYIKSEIMGDGDIEIGSFHPGRLHGCTFIPPNEEPPKGAIVIRLSKDGGFGHVGISVGDWKVVDLIPKPGSVGSYILQAPHDLRDSWHEGEDGEGLYLGAGLSDGWTEQIGENIADLAIQRQQTGETGVYSPIPIGASMDCVEFVTETLEAEGIDPGFSEFSRPGAIYEMYSEKFYPEFRKAWWLYCPDPSLKLVPFRKLEFQRIKFISAGTPEDKYGLTGFDNINTTYENKSRYVSNDKNFYYKIDFWNKENASAPACDVYVNDQVDANLNWSTFRFEEIGFLNWTIKLEPCQYFNVYVDTRPEMNLLVNAEGIFNPETGAINWTFKSLDPVTLETPDDPSAGFLPPITDSGYEVGWVCFSVDPDSNLPTGTSIQNQAFVNFDGVGPFNPAPKERPYLNTIDAAPPTSNMTAELLDEYLILLNLSGTDDPNGSGIKDYTIYVSVDDTTDLPFMTHIINTSVEYSGEYGHTYSFYCTARDNVGNKENPPITPDAVINTSNSPPTALFNFTPLSPAVGEIITFNASQSYDPDGSIINYYWSYGDGNYMNTTEKTTTHSYTSPGNYTVTLTITDNDGLTDIYTEAITVIRDIIPPQTTIIVSQPKYGLDDIWVTSYTEFNLIATDDSSGVDKTYYRIWYNNEWTSLIEYNGNFTLSGEDTHYIEYYSVDNVVNIEGIHNQTHYVDDTPPTTTHSLSGTLGSNNWYISIVNVTLTVSDSDGSGVNKTLYRINSGSWQMYTNKFTLSTDGTHIVDYYSTDLLGNTETIISVTVKIDKTAPLSSILKPQKGWLYIFDNKIYYVGQTIVVGWVTVKINAVDTGSGIQKVEFYIDNKLKSTDTTAPYEWKWNEKIYNKHKLKTIAYDQLGNKNSVEMDVWIFRWW